MESFLNLLWLVFATAALLLWCASWTRAFRPSSRPRNPFREAAAITCALVILFFAVSLTDDLHSEIVYIEDSVAARRHAGQLDSQSGSSHAPGLGSSTMFAVAAPSARLVVPGFVGLLSPIANSAAAPRSAPAASGRAPPLAFL